MSKRKRLEGWPLKESSEGGQPAPCCDATDDGIVLGVPSICEHFFHAECIKIWSARESSCPQCRKRFRRLDYYDGNGALRESTRVAAAYFGDLLAAEEESNDNVQVDEEAAIETASVRRRRRRRVTQVRHRRNEPSTVRATPVSILPPVESPEEVALRKELRRRVEAERRRRKTAGISVGEAMKAINSSLSRSPFGIAAAVSQASSAAAAPPETYGNKQESMTRVSSAAGHVSHEQQAKPDSPTDTSATKMALEKLQKQLFSEAVKNNAAPLLKPSVIVPQFKRPASGNFLGTSFRSSNQEPVKKAKYQMDFLGSHHGG